MLRLALKTAGRCLMSFRIDKAVAMAVYFLDKAPGNELNDIKLMKLMVLAERRAMVESTCMITGDNFYSMQHGPVLSNTLNAMNGSAESETWNRHIQYTHYDNVASNRSK